ncbi:GNAT family N-acetyltransferase [Streptomyces sp. SCA3-4]|uniref:GNAT family N-acetyltransferase n=1 Tax=Streptomyces sichuanensis TaxID=2871810 RepID=UPI001CE23E6A|nr:GNAT family protein [Streptomyces sichuanensis]MCA6091321.1 GNAT family N-acetyltransferase [Streptomyces sichuanensis]
MNDELSAEAAALQPLAVGAPVPPRNDVETDGLAARTVLASRKGIVLAEPVATDEETLASRGDGAFDVDREADAGPLPISTPIGRACILDDVTGDLLGSVSWHAVGYGPAVSCLAWNIGIVLLPSARGRGVGSTATRLLAEHLFATTDVFRVELSTDVTNVAAQQTAQRAGFHREGVIRGAQLRKGRRRDLVGYSLLRSDL